jgi:hypothetical protein
MAQSEQSSHQASPETTELSQRGWAMLLAGYMLALIIFGVAHEPAMTPQGLLSIARSPGMLVSDYVAIGGLNAAFVNSGVIGLASLLLVLFNKVRLSGPTIAGIFTIAGFGFFGKNWWSIWPIILGVALFSRVVRRPFKSYILVAMFGTALAPLVTQVTYGFNWGLVPGSLFGIGAGFLLPPVAVYMLRLHQGFNIYNVGLSCGFLGLFITAMLAGTGHDIPATFYWSEQYSALLGGFLLIYSLSMLIIGLILGRGRHGVSQARELVREVGTLPTDFVELYGASASLINMGLIGLLAWGYIALVGGTFNGPTLGGAFTMIGFAAFGKHILNVPPVMAGVYVGSSLLIWEPAQAGPLLAALFATTLAPISGRFGPLVGVIAGMVHLMLVMRTGAWHAGLNLYNNGFAGGLTATLFTSLISWWSSWREER